MTAWRKARKLAGSVSPEAHALEDAALSAVARASLLRRIQAGGHLTDVEVPELPDGTDWLADRARARRGRMTDAQADALRAELADRVAAAYGYADHAERLAAERRGRRA